MPADNWWEKLNNLDPTEVVTRTRARAPEKGLYEVDVLDRVCRVDLKNHDITVVGPAFVQAAEGNLQVAIMMYLLEAKPIEPMGTWVSPRDLNGGAQFFKGPHAVPVARISGYFGSDKEGFSRICKSLGGTPLKYGDAAFAFSFFPRLPIAAVLWLADDEFSARASLLVDKTAGEHMPLDALLGALGSLENLLTAGVREKE